MKKTSILDTFAADAINSPAMITGGGSCSGGGKSKKGKSRKGKSKKGKSRKSKGSRSKSSGGGCGCLPPPCAPVEPTKW